MADNQDSSKKLPPVGPGNPPVHTRFQKGQSGNPAGRPAGGRRLSARFKTLLREEAERPVRASLGLNPQILPADRAAIRSLAQSAALGRPKARALFIDLVSAADEEDETQE
jgi:hypothetical protein